ncbi:MAG: 50S ribosomal protein L11 [Parcubacteria group bacterium GW2011_GWD2_38_12]|uniref:Large ribosomal subunit protein uL11 n=1 Tax=Candidatus Azambacteria bacterium RIFCSPLOWO2_01_FULL_37_9 TaxID=1797297 RepID=A0A1F5C7D6_9BACT|nr:MAG: 50S ribosomal protein L11 [Parcubacteria group bacterium GW2011_GWC2_36_17]KKQ42437.1 MAG: 50S ribosomal protein L11 [Parcubacteria group bacterium GW2011_GWE2_37_8]KKQ51002.1 MAG: 50S ribosomal protein L11 [Parcubacteria group bacterium GW2011_GWD2_38_12]KKQ58060.1 MAG: 50S ribosomal protein L11 [Parcubacteria group bacterium GW2011_GWD1_38_16]KKQ58646.1 MAG: 50S ribosomal protein L11 [Parcubacteria group bacterium GW2011_GWC1_38_17]OGD38761.1 MAG: 50S ribosomal protein L11 [Candidatu
MAKPIKTILKIQLPAGKATPAPPVGTALGPHGLNIQQFCLQFNEATKDKEGSIIPAEITIYEDRTFTFRLKTPPASDLLKKAAKVEKGSATPLTGKVGSITKQQLKEIAEIKMTDLNANDVDGAMNIIAGTARNMGITIKD